MMQEDFRSTNETNQALRLLSVGWNGVLGDSDHIIISLMGGKAVRIGVEAEDFGDRFECFRVSAEKCKVRSWGVELMEFCQGPLSVSALDTHCWLEPFEGSGAGLLGENPVLQAAGPQASVPVSASHVCSVTDGVLIEASTNVRCIITCAPTPFHMQVLTQPDAIDEYLSSHEVRRL
jgi:hypothetical protein